MTETIGKYERRDNWIAIGFLVAIGWFSGKIIFSIIEEILFERLHSSKYYRIICKKQTIKKSNDSKKMTIGFLRDDERS